MMKLILRILAAAYLVTWVGGWLAHSREMSRLAATLYVEVQAHNVQQRDWARQNNDREEPFQIKVLPAGLKSRVNWCFPIFPGILLADSHYVVGPSFGKGSTKVVVYYGVGSFTLQGLWGWIS